MAEFAPGSFTKNYGWNQDAPGLRKLHRVIRLGFAEDQGSVLRDTFRDRIDHLPSSPLLPLNFFLHNTVLGNRNYVTRDELVRQALASPHSWSFDHLALFAFHLGRVGERTGRSGDAVGAAFANDYVRSVLWQGEGWIAAATSIDSIDAHFGETIIVTGKGVAHKCATNYHYILELVGLTAQKTALLNSRWRDWVGSAAFLLFDRFSADGPRGRMPTAESLLQSATQAEFHKLIGATQDEADEYLPLLAQSYLDLGGLGRPEAALPAPSPAVAEGAPRPATAPPKWSDDAAQEADQVQRRIRELKAQIRNPSNVRELKTLYGHRCCFCQKSVQVGVDPDAFYSEGAHIKPLGAPHNGPDAKSNMVLLCPEHHLQLDRGILRMRTRNGVLTIDSRIDGDPLHGRPVTVQQPHVLDHLMIAWHFNFWAPR